MASTNDDELYAIDIPSPYMNNLEIFNAQSELSYPDVDVFVFGSDGPLRLHRSLLAQASNTFANMFKGVFADFCQYNESLRRVDWSHVAEGDLVYPNVFVKFMRFLYGEQLHLIPLECGAALALVFQLQLSCKDSLQQQLEANMTRISSCNVVFGSIMLKACSFYPECHQDNMSRVDILIAKNIFSRDNITENYGVVVSNCLLELPALYLDYVQFGEPHTSASEFNIRLEYIQRMRTFLEPEVCRNIIIQCDFSQINGEELIRLQSLAIVSADDLLSIYQQVVKRYEKQIDDLKKQRDEEKMRADKAETMRTKHHHRSERKSETSTGLHPSVQSPQVCSQPEGGPISKIEQLGWNVNKGDVDATYELGLCHFKGDGVSQNKAKAIELWNIAARAGNANALFALGRCFAKGDGVEMNKTTASHFYQRAADLGNSDAMYYLGSLYAHGDGVPLDKAKAIDFYRRAADRNNSLAMYALGVCYSHGDGVVMDKAKAVELLNGSANLGNAYAMVILGACYANGDGVAQDKARAVFLYEKASNKGNPFAMYALGMCYANGDGVKKDQKLAIELWKKSASLGNGFAAATLKKYNCKDD